MISVRCPVCSRRWKLTKRVCVCGADLIALKNRGAVSYVVKIRLSNSDKFIRTTEKTLAAARETESRQKLMKVKGQMQTKTSIKTFKQLAEWYLGLSKVKRLAMYEAKCFHYKLFNQRFGSLNPTKLKQSMLEDFQVELLDQGKSKAYIDYIIGTAAASVNKAFENDEISGDCLKPFRRLKKMLKTNANARNQIFTHEQFDALIDEAPLHIRQIMTTAYYTGMRRGEILNLKWWMVNMKERIITLPPEITKDDEPRHVPFPDPVFKALQMTPKVLRCPYVFTYRGKKLSEIRKGLRIAFDKAKIPYGRNIPGGFTFHDFRHTYVTNMRRAGVQESVIMKITGHSTHAVFQRYNLVDESDAKVAMQQFQNFVQERRLIEGKSDEAETSK